MISFSRGDTSTACTRRTISATVDPSLNAGMMTESLFMYVSFVATIASMTDFKYEGRDLEAMSFAVRYHEWILSFFRPFLGKRVAEVGAGAGSFSALLLREPIEMLVAIEPSSDMFRRLAEEMKSEARVVSHNAFLSEVYERYVNTLDSIVYVNVFEHVEDDEKELSLARSCLRDGGHICIFVPALPWLYSEHDASIGHFRRYTKKELHERVRKAGFEIVSARYFDIAGVFPWLFLVKFLKKSPAPGAVKMYDSFVVPISRLVEGVLPPPVGKNLLVVGRKCVM